MECSDKTAEGLTFSEAFATLYNHSRPIGMGALNHYCDREIRTDEEAMRVFYTYCSGDGYCDYVRGRQIKENFWDFPKRLSQSARESLRRQPTSFEDKSFKTPSDCDRCDYFTKEALISLGSYEALEFVNRFETCMILSNNRDDAKQKFQWGAVANKLLSTFVPCRADYTIREYNSVNLVGHRGIPCHEALDYTSMLDGSRNFIDDFRVCHALSSNSTLRLCRAAKGSLQLGDVIEILSRTPGAETEKV